MFEVTPFIISSLLSDGKTLRYTFATPKSAVTDTGDTPEGEMSPGIQNLFLLLKASGRMDGHESLMTTYNNGTLKYSELKEAVAEGLVALSAGFVERKNEILADKKQLKYEIKQSSANIRKIAQETLREVKDLCGLVNVKF